MMASLEAVPRGMNATRTLSHEPAQTSAPLSGMGLSAGCSRANVSMMVPVCVSRHQRLLSPSPEEKCASAGATLQLLLTTVTMASRPSRGDPTSETTPHPIPLALHDRLRLWQMSACLVAGGALSPYVLQVASVLFYKAALSALAGKMRGPQEMASVCCRAGCPTCQILLAAGLGVMLKGC